MSFRAQQAGGFRVERLPWDAPQAYDVIKAPEPVWRLRLLEDRGTPVPDQVRFRIDFSAFVRNQHSRSRKAMAMLASGDKRCEVADRLGITASAITQRMARVEREWNQYQADDESAESDWNVATSGNGYGLRT